ncbi:MAG: FtsX-like permease family protein [Spirochaetota bacterium]
MLKNNLWLALTNIKRKKIASILFFTVAFFISHSIFLLNISSKFIMFPEISGSRQFFLAIIITFLALCILVLGAVAVLLIKVRKHELGIFRMLGARRADVLVVSSLEILILSLSGSILGVVSIILLILLKVIYLPFFLQGMYGVRIMRFIATGGQTIFMVTLIEMAIYTILLYIFLKKDITDMLRGTS